MGEPTFPIGLMLERTAQFLERQAAPNLSSRMLAHKTTSSANLLRLLAVMVEENAHDLQDENAAMRQALGSVLESLSRERPASRRKVVGVLKKRLANDLSQAGALGLTGEHLQLKGALVETIKALDNLGLSAETVSSLRRQIRAAMRQQLDHSLARIASVKGSR